MKTFIWADHELSFTSDHFFVAQAENVAEARLLIKNQLKSDYECKIKQVDELKIKAEYRNDLQHQKHIENWLSSRKNDYEQDIASIDKYEPTHIISADMGMRIYHANY